MKRQFRIHTTGRITKSENGWATVLALIVVVLLIAVVDVLVWHRQSRRDSSSINTNTASNAGNPSSTIGTLPVGSSQASIQINGITRTYITYRPAGLSGTVPLVVMLHGGGGSGAIAEKFYGWDEQADSGKFIVAYPDGLGTQTPAWNVNGSSLDGKPCCGYPAQKHIDDVAFIKAMVSAIEGGADIDKNRIYDTGISNGGIMAYTLACETNLFAAIGPDSATMLNTCSNPAPTSVIHIHGLQDMTIKFNGGVGEPPADIDGPPIPTVIADWQKTDNCSTPSSSTQGVVTTEIANCANGRSVELIALADGGHGWPGAPLKSAQSTEGGREPSQAIDATSVIWQFFAAHPKPGS